MTTLLKVPLLTISFFINISNPLTGGESDFDELLKQGVLPGYRGQVLYIFELELDV